jgi:hypothetical protein
MCTEPTVLDPARLDVLLGQAVVEYDAGGTADDDH